MSTIRPLVRADLPDVAALYEQVARSGRRAPPAGLADYIGRFALEQPWADEDIPTLVAEAPDGGIVGFLGSNPRRMRMDGMPLRLACSGNLVAHPGHPGVGAMLTRAYLHGPQDVSITDGATDLMYEMWTEMRGRCRVAASFGWYQVFRPFRTVARVLAERDRRVPRAATALADPADTLARHLPRVGSRFTAAGARTSAGRRGNRGPPAPTSRVPAPREAADETGSEAEELTSARLLEQMVDAPGHLRLYPDYDAPHLDWVFAELAAEDAVAARGRLVRHLVRHRNGRVRGWYVYLLPRAGIAEVLQIAAPGPELGPVLDHLLADAERAGAAAVHGRLEPALAPVVRARRCAVRPTSWALVHTDDMKILGLLGSADALLTRLDGEWWMGHHVLWRDGDPR